MPTVLELTAIAQHHHSISLHIAVAWEQTLKTEDIFVW
jgi:hypothetical protein